MDTPTKPKLHLLAIRLPHNADRVTVNAALEQIAKDNGYLSKYRRTNPTGSIGQMLYALATGQAMIVNLAPPQEEEETPKKPRRRKTQSTLEK